MSTKSDKYRAELYDEVWQRARDMGYGNVTDALAEVERLKDRLDIAQTFIEQLTKVVTVNGSSLSQRANEILIAMQDPQL
jgi:hypothetical protein